MAKTKAIKKAPQRATKQAPPKKSEAKKVKRKAAGGRVTPSKAKTATKAKRGAHVKKAAPLITAAFPPSELLRPRVHNPSLWEPERPSKSLWSRIREEVLFRDNWTCFYCKHKAYKYMNLHHKGDSSDNNPKNLAPLCVACHAVQHFGRNLDLGTVAIWESPLSQLEIVKRTRAGIRKGLSLEHINKSFDLKLGPFSPSSLDYANAVVHTMGDRPEAALPEPLCVVFVNFERWQIGEDEWAPVQF